MRRAKGRWYIGVLGAVAFVAVIALRWAVPATYFGGAGYRNAIFLAASWPHEHCLRASRSCVVVSATVAGVDRFLADQRQARALLTAAVSGVFLHKAVSWRMKAKPVWGLVHSSSNGNFVVATYRSGVVLGLRRRVANLFRRHLNRSAGSNTE